MTSYSRGVRKLSLHWATYGLSVIFTTLAPARSVAQPHAVAAATEHDDDPSDDHPSAEERHNPRPADPTQTDGDDDPRTPAPTATPRPRRRAHGHFFSRSDDARERTEYTARRRQRRPAGAPDVLQVRGAPDAFFYRPGARRRRVIVYLHARGADPEASCRQLRTAVSPYGWLLCPVGPVDRGNGRHEWNNDPITAHRYAMAALSALSARFSGRVLRTDNVVMGFSEGAFVAMQLGMTEPRTFPRWVIFAGTDYYLTSDSTRWAEARRHVRRVYLFTGENDNVVGQTRRAEAHLRREHVGRVHLRVMQDMGHQLPSNNVTLGRALRFVMR